MTWTRPRRLYRILSDLPKPLFQVETDTFTVQDDQILGISINHGGSIDTGLAPSTAEFETLRPSWVQSGDDVKITLNSAAASAIAALTGVPAIRFRTRFTGRIGRQVNDETARRMTGTFAAASWSAQLSRIPRSNWEDAGTPIQHVIRRLVTPQIIAEKINFVSYGDFEVTAEDQADVSDIGLYTSELGVLLRDTRDGDLEAWSLPYWESWSRGRVNLELPLTRSEALSPAKWQQPNESMPHRQRIEFIDTNGELRASSRGGTLENITDEHDWTHIRFLSESWDTRLGALVAQNYDRLFRIPSIEVDILHLLASPREYHRRQAGQLLALNRGDTVNLSGDWHPYIRGAHIAIGIDEQITNNSWTMRLSLTPWRTIFGGLSSPDVPALLWDQISGTWDDAEGTWNERAFA